MNTKIYSKLACALLIGTALSGCNMLNRLAAVGEEPTLATINNPTHEPDYKPVSMPMPSPLQAAPHSNSLWRPGSRAFLKDLRANEIGDIVTVIIDIDDEATLNNSTTRTRTVTDTTGVSSLLGYEASLGAILPEAIDPTSLLSVDTDVSQVGGGVVDRDEDIDFEIAAVVTQVLPNGNLVIHGRQETRVNYEVRELQVAGVIRPQDITTSNQIAYEDIAEARLAYGGRGHISDMTQPRYGSQIIDIILPF
ncbi:flagellar basal body L-ring protein FlgH [Aestuariispira insulae]|uniref:Flagellar L-ring protein n=1 Tax=Aestuariispira insulae TaxID=1461337 RepID=A0A3D9HU94_9PROT|nr:flagellar basal body L-ring protein FlgH [Aestuariispira insulae]RED52456.1 flagellar L-ring protein precursor FlgH [Aestuariispira insulae]